MSFHCLMEETEKGRGPKINSDFVAELGFLSYLTTKQTSECGSTGPLWSCMNSQPLMMVVSVVLQ